MQLRKVNTAAKRDSDSSCGRRRPEPPPSPYRFPAPCSSDSPTPSAAARGDDRIPAHDKSPILKRKLAIYDAFSYIKTTYICLLLNLK